MPAALTLLALLPTAAGAQDAAVIDQGLHVYKTKADCAECHGWRGAGGPANDEPDVTPGPSLVRSTMDREAMIEIVACGTPGGQMPKYLADAWTEARSCYGQVAADLAPDGLPPAPYTVLQPHEIEAVVTYVQEIYQGRGMTLDDCIRYFDPNSPACNRFR